MSDDLDRLLEIGPRPAAGRPAEAAALSPQGRWMLRAFLGFLGVTALFGLIVVLAGNMGEFEGKVLLSTVAISMGSLCGLASFEYARRSGNTLPGGAGTLLALVATLLILAGIWTEHWSDDYWKITGVLAVFAAACAHFFGLSLARVRPAHQWVLVVAGIAIFSLAAVIAGLIVKSFDGGADVYKLIAVLAIVDLAATIAIPILHRLDRAELAGPLMPGASSAERFMVTLQPDGTYLTDDGRVLVQRHPST
ncbi:MAG: hypothetical protein L0099_07485 [Acidobacteria bacterium]|nr:hypothetical protein [Acidobacteriota bacterium]